MSFADKNPVAIAKLMGDIGGDGHSILPPQWLNAHVDETLHDLIEPMIGEHKSNFSHPKLTIFKEGYPVESLVGVRALDIQFKIAQDLGLKEVVDEALEKVGRGYQAECLSRGILKSL